MSGDSSEDIKKGRHKHGVKVTMLADPELVVTTRYGLRNEKNISPTGIAALPIPTTILVDANGIVRWIDKSKDYQQRSDPSRVRAAISNLP